MESFLDKVPNKLKRSFQICLDMAKQNPSRFKFCCVALNKSGHIISMSFQQGTKTHPLQVKYANKVNLNEKIYLHAEIATIIKATNPTTLFVCRVDFENKVVLSKPCPICELAIKQSSIQQCYYTTNNQTIELLEF